MLPPPQQTAYEYSGLEFHDRQVIGHMETGTRLHPDIIARNPGSHLFQDQPLRSYFDHSKFRYNLLHTGRSRDGKSTSTNDSCLSIGVAVVADHNPVGRMNFQSPIFLSQHKISCRGNLSRLHNYHSSGFGR